MKKFLRKCLSTQEKTAAEAFKGLTILTATKDYEINLLVTEVTVNFISLCGR